MSAGAEGTCRRCGATKSPIAEEELCPACLMSVALETVEDPVEDAASASIQPLLREGRIDLPREFGGYRLLELLGRGGMGTVYEAEHLATGRRVALKMLAHQLDSPEVRKRFLREGRLAAGVNHPNSLYVFGSEEIDGLPVITMEIAGSGTLDDRLKECGTLPVTEAVDAVLDVISGLDAAFKGGVLHRDIKPSNCFVAPDGSVKVGDFGLSVSILARHDTFVTAHRSFMGTPAYASPEQLQGGQLDVRADIYSVGATLFTLLTGRPPFEGTNAVQVAANAVNQKPKPVTELRGDVPHDLERVVARCLSKEPGGRYSDYATLADALLPFGSREPAPAAIPVRSQAGWVDYLIAFLIPYVVLMLAVGAEEFHFGLFEEGTLYSARYYVAFLGFGFLYFSIAEGIWGAGFGKRLKGLRVIRTGGGPPGIGRALIRVALPIFCIEVFRIPILMASIAGTPVNDLTGTQVAIFFCACLLCPWIPIVFLWRARPENDYTTLWDVASGTRVVVKPKGNIRPPVQPEIQSEVPGDDAESLGPYRILEEKVRGKWVVAIDPVLRRRIWLLRRDSPELPVARQTLARPGRLRWLQKVETDEATWDAFEAIQGVPFSDIVEGGKRIPWSTLRHWLHDIASELETASGDQTLPAELSLDHVWITTRGNAVLLDEPWASDSLPAAERFSGTDVPGRQRFLNAIAARVESTSLPLHAHRVLEDLKDGRFTRANVLADALRELLERPSEVGVGTRGGAIFMLPLFVWILLLVAAYTGEGRRTALGGDSVAWLALKAMFLVLFAGALVQLLLIPFGTSTSHSVFRLAVVDARGEPARVPRLLQRWAIAWLPLGLPVALLAWLQPPDNISFICALVLLLLWAAVAASAVVHPPRGLHDRLAGTWVVRR